MKRILVPTDFSECANHALELACEIALKNDAKLLLLHTVEHPFGGGVDPTGASVFQSFDDDLLQRQLIRGRSRMADVVAKMSIPAAEITQLVEIGHPANMILDKIREFGIELVVMGTNGTAGILEIFAGSNAEKVVRNASCPVISLKSRVKLDDVKRIAFASDFDKFNGRAMASLKQMQDVLGARIDFVRINTLNNFQRDALTFKQMDVLVRQEMFLKSTLHVYNDYSEEEGLVHFAMDMKSDMIGMITHGRTGLSHLLNGSIAEDVVNHANMPVWTMRIAE
jgi:nucleotide-binding universal stress UspA family protein